MLIKPRSERSGGFAPTKMSCGEAPSLTTLDIYPILFVDLLPLQQFLPDLVFDHGRKFDSYRNLVLCSSVVEQFSLRGSVTSAVLPRPNSAEGIPLRSFWTDRRSYEFSGFTQTGVQMD